MFLKKCYAIALVMLSGPVMSADASKSASDADQATATPEKKVTDSTTQGAVRATATKKSSKPAEVDRGEKPAPKAIRPADDN